jgi:hypothetical protein
MRGRKNNKGLGSGGESRSRSKSRKIKCYECHEVGNIVANIAFEKIFLNGKIKEKKKEMFYAANIASE